MPEISVTKRDGTEVILESELGISAMEAMRNAGIDEILALCGGCCSCATCHVYVDESNLRLLDRMSSDEDDLLDSSEHRRFNSRLSCQIFLDDRFAGLRIALAPED
jgi:2Fe-2S ferredoxin